MLVTIQQGGFIMNLLITGGTGFVGEKLIEKLHERNIHTYILTRSPEQYDQTPLATYIGYHYHVKRLPRITAVINLAGDTLFGYWTKNKKERILTSRVETTARLINFLKQMPVKPEVLINGSAVGYYGTAPNLIFTEQTIQPGTDFLAHVVTEWENTAKQAETYGVRTVYARFGVILGEKGALPLMSLPIKFFAGGKIGDGEQWLSWIHIDDVVQLLLFCLDHSEIDGPVNITSPSPKRNKDFIKTLALELKRPAWLPTPAPLLRTVAGEMSTLMTKGQYVLPEVAQNHGYSFLYPELKEALAAIRLSRK